MLGENSAIDESDYPNAKEYEEKSTKHSYHTDIFYNIYPVRVPIHSPAFFIFLIHLFSAPVFKAGKNRPDRPHLNHA